MPFGFHILWMVGTLVFIMLVAGVTAIVIWAIRASARPAYPAGPQPTQGAMPPATARETPLEILARRFASGDITAEDYERARDLLGGDGRT